jgi:transcriptional regulator with XRE-family HTH domain
MSIGILIKLLRTAEGLSQTTLASELGVARTYLSRIENDKIEPGLSFLKAVSRRFNVPLSLLFIGYSKDNKEIFGELQKLLGHVLSAQIALKME